MILPLLFPLLFSGMALTGEVHIDEKPVTLGEHSSVLCSCSSFVVQYRKDLPLMDAWKYVVATDTPSVGAVAKMYYPHSGAYHVALVTAVGEDTVTIAETNYVPCAHGVRVIPKDYSRLLGYL